MDIKDIEKLAHRIKNGEASEKELQLFNRWYDEHDDSRAFLNDRAQNAESLKIKMFNVVRRNIRPTNIWKLKRNLSSVVVVTVFAVIVCSIIIYSVRFSSGRQGAKPRIALIVPGKNHAILTLANGKKIILTDLKDGILSDQSGVKITKTASGGVVYQINKNATNEPNSFNTFETPRGGQFEVDLPDGSKVLLNAASSIRFSTAISKLKQRRVELRGEAYFEIAKDKKRPFVVETPQQDIEVLGTHFNVNSYDNEPDRKITLLEGAVKVHVKGLNKFEMLKPGEQSILRGSSLRVIQVDSDSETAWRNNEFIFTGQNTESIMRMISRWYDVDIKYEFEPDKTTEFDGQLSRARSLDAVLTMLRESSGLKFKIKGREVIISK